LAKQKVKLNRDITAAARLIDTQRAERAGSALLRPISARFMHRKKVEAYEKAYPDLQDRQRG
jgi:uncharacterized DUF497 family protein